VLSVAETQPCGQALKYDSENAIEARRKRAIFICSLTAEVLIRKRTDFGAFWEVLGSINAEGQGRGM
jgi:hypothetical protein